MAEIPASSGRLIIPGAKPIGSKSSDDVIADSLANGDSDALAEDESTGYDEIQSDSDAKAEALATKLPADPYVDNVDSEIVDRSQDDLADSRPEVVILSINVNGDDDATDTALPLDSSPRY